MSAGVATNGDISTASTNAPAATGAKDGAVKDESGVALMTEGRVFTSYSLQDGNVQQKELFVYYDGNEGKLGALFWCDAGKREKVSGQSVPLHHIADVFLGKQKPELQSALSSDAPSDRCFSIVTKEANLSLHLRCESAALRNSFLQGIKEIFSRASTAQRSPLQSMQKGGVFTCVIGQGETAQKKEIFVYFDPAEGKLGSLLWCDVGKKEKVAGQVMPLHHITDVFLGKQSPELKAPVVADVTSAHCFSVKSKETQLHLVATSDKIREHWLAGIKEVFTQNADKKKQKHAAAANTTNGVPTADKGADSPKDVPPVVSAAAETPVAEKVKAEEGKSEAPSTPPAVPGGPTQQQPTEQAAPVQETTTPVAPLTVAATPTAQQAQPEPASPKPTFSSVSSPTAAAGASTATATATGDSGAEGSDGLAGLTRGFRVTRYTVNPAGSEQLFIFYDNDQPKLGALYWNVTNDRTKTADFIVMHRISDVFMGKQTPELKQASVTQSSNLCFSVLERGGKSLHLVAHSESERKEILEGIKLVFSRAGKQVQDASKKDNKEKEKEKEKEKAVAAATPVAAIAAAATNGTAKESSTANTTATAAPQAPTAAYSFVVANSAPATTSAAAPATVAAAAATPTASAAAVTPSGSASEQSDELKFLTAGGKLTAIFGKENSVKKEILLWLEPKEEKLGTLHWSTDGSRTAAADAFLPLHRITDVFIGKQTHELKSAAAAEFSSSLCFALSGKERQLHLIASSVAEKDKWLGGIKSVFTSSGKKVDDTKKSKPAAKDTAAAATPASTTKDAAVTPSAASTPATPSTATAAATPTAASAGNPLETGATFTAFFGTEKTVSKKVFVFVDLSQEKYGTLYYNEDNKKEKVSDNSLPLHLVSDVYLGKTTTELKSSEAASYASNQCFSLHTKQKAVHLAADSSATRKQWLQAIREVLTSKGKSVQEENLRKKPAPLDTKAASSGGADILSPTSPAAVHISGASAASPSNAHTELMKKGQDVWGYFTEASGVVRKRIFIFFERSEGKYGTLYWVAAGSDRSAKSVERCIPFHSITDVYVGKKTPEFASVVASAAPVGACFSLKAKTNQINVEADSDAIKTAWINAVRSVFSTAGKQVQESRPASPGASSKTGLDLLTSGVSWKLFDDSKAKQVYLWYDTADFKHGALHWNEKTGAKEKVAEQFIALHKISDVFLGKQTPELKAQDKVHIDRALSLKTKHLILNFETRSSEERNNFVAALRGIFESKGKKVVEDAAALAARNKGGVVEDKEEKKAKSDIVVGTFVQTPYGFGFVTEGPRADGIVAVQANYAVVNSPLADVQNAEYVWTPYGVGHVVLELTRARNDNVLVVKLPYAQGFIDATAAKAIPAPKKKGPPEYTREEALDILTAGEVFTCYIPTPNATPLKSSLYFWYEAEDKDAKPGTLGTLYWIDATYRTEREKYKSPKQSTPIRRITDLFLGRQSKTLQAVVEKLADTQCFALATKHVSLDLHADSEVQRNRFVYSIYGLLLGAGKRVVEQKSAPSAGATIMSSPSSSGSELAPPQPKSQRRFSFAKPALPPVPTASEFLTTPHTFTLHSYSADGKNLNKETVWLSAQLKGTSAVSAFIIKKSTGTTTQYEGSLMRDVYLGKRTKVFGQSALADLAADNCFSLAFRDKSDRKQKIEVDFEAPGKDQRDQFFYGLYAILNSGKQKGASSPSNIASSPSSASSPRSANPYLAGGHDFIAYWAEKDGSVYKQAIKLFYTEAIGKLGSLYWTTDGSSKFDSEKTLEVRKVSDVFFGRQTPVLKSSTAADAPLNALFSLVSQHLTLNLQAPSDDVRKKWLDNFKTIFSIGGKRVVENTAKQGKASVPSGIMQGEKFFLWRDGKKTPALLYYDADEGGRLGSFYIGEGETPKQKSSATQLPLHQITDLHVSKQAFPAEAAVHANASACLSIVVKGLGSFHLEAENNSQRDRWVATTGEIFKAGGKRVVDNNNNVVTGFSVPPTPAAGSAARAQSPFSPSAGRINEEGASNGASHPALPSVPAELISKVVAKRPSILAVRPDGVLSTLTRGVQFVRITESDSTEEVNVFYEPEPHGKDLGKIYYCNKGERIIIKDNVIPLSELTDVLLGRQTPALLRRNDLTDVQCVSLKADHGRELNLFADSSDKLSTWLFGVTNLLNAGGMSIVLENDPAQQSATPTANGLSAGLLVPKSGTPRRFSVGNRHGASSSGSTAAPATILALPSRDTARIVTNGRVFGLYEIQGSSPDTLVWYESGSDGKLGSIYWNKSKERVRVAGYSLALAEVVRVYIGKHTSVLQSAPADPNCSVSLVAASGEELNLEAKNEETLSAWLLGINTLLVDVGGKLIHAHHHADIGHGQAFIVIDAKDSQAYASSAAAAASEAASAAAAAAAVVSSDPYADATLLNDPARLRSFIEKGHTFTGYSLKGDRLSSKRMVIWLGQDADGDTYFYWVQEGAPRVGDVSSGIDVEEITDVKAGKQSATFTGTAQLADVDASRCFTIESEHVTLDIVADTPDAAQAWVKAVKAAAPKLKVK